MISIEELEQLKKDFITLRNMVNKRHKKEKKAFKELAKRLNIPDNTVTEIDIVFQIIKTHKWISEKQLTSAIWRDIDSSKFKDVIEILIKEGKICREYKGVNKEIGIWYRPG